jgi:tetratricopeptide (TPR) repeat protein
MLAEIGRHEGALAAFERALFLDAAYVDACYGKGATLLELDRGEEALAVFEQALALDRDDPLNWTFKANARRQFGREAEASKADTLAEELDG